MWNCLGKIAWKAESPSGGEGGGKVHHQVGKRLEVAVLPDSPPSQHLGWRKRRGPPSGHSALDGPRVPGDVNSPDPRKAKNKHFKPNSTFAELSWKPAGCEGYRREFIFLLGGKREKT